MPKINIRGVGFDDVTLDEAYAFAMGYIQSPPSGAPAVIFTPNSEIVQTCVENPQLYTVINSADLIIPDGSGILLAGRILGTPLKQKVAGIDLAYRILSGMEACGARLFILGGKPGIPERAAARIRRRYPHIEICGVRDGYFGRTAEANEAVVEQINAAAPDALFVCLGAPAQEKWIAANCGRLNVKIAAGFGGTVDNLAGTAKRAPRLMVKLHLEWFYRLVRQPSRLPRMMKIPRFIIGTFKAKLTRTQINR